MTFIFRTFLVLVLLFFKQHCLFAQINTIKATVSDKAGNPWIGNLVLTDSTHKTIRTMAFNGSFQISGLDHQILKLKLSSLFFADTTFNMMYTGSKNVDLGNIIPGENRNTLRQVNITSAVPIMRYGSNGNIEVNVAGTILASSSSVNEILSRTPGVVINEGTISIQGKGEAIIYLNGAVVPSERLASIPASQITKIEIISNPSARYDAAGRAVIHITTGMPNENGVNARFAQHLTYSDFAGTNANTFADLGYVKNKLTLSANVALLKGAGRELLYTTRVRPDPDDYLNSELSTDWNRDFKLYTTYGAGAKYSFSRTSSLGVSVNGNRDNLGGMVNSNNRILTSATANFYGSNVERDELRNNTILIADFNTITDTLGSGFFISGQYAKYNTDYNDGIDESGGSFPRYLKNTFKQDLHINSLQADRTKFYSKITKLETGLRFSTVGNSSLNQFATSDKKDGIYYPEENLSSSFRYEETISAGYGSFVTKMGTMQINLGIRGEWTNYSLATTAGNGQNFRKNYFSLFPNLHVELPVSERNKLRVAYSSRISRPRYQALNPFVIYQDPFTTIEGNPNLLPERAQTVELSANLNKTELKLAYTYTTDQLTAAAIRGNTPESYVLKSINISSDQSYLLSLTRPFSIGNWWQSINTINLSYAKSIDDTYGFSIGESKPQVYIYSSNTFNLNHGIKLQLLAWYLGDRYYSLRHDDKRSVITAGIEKTLLNSKLKIGFTANDILDKTSSAGDYNVGRTQIYYNRNYGNQYFRLTVNYRFGSAGKAISPNSKPVQPENSRAN